jgi:hypothetical protein
VFLRVPGRCTVEKFLIFWSEQGCQWSEPMDIPFIDFKLVHDLNKEMTPHLHNFLFMTIISFLLWSEISFILSSVGHLFVSVLRSEVKCLWFEAYFRTLYWVAEILVFLPSARRYSSGWALASWTISLHSSIRSLTAASVRDTFLCGPSEAENVSLTPNPQPGGPGYPSSSGSFPLTCPAWVTLPVATIPQA